MFFLFFLTFCFDLGFFTAEFEHLSQTEEFIFKCIFSSLAD